MARLDNEWAESGLLETIFIEIAEIGDRIQIQTDATISMRIKAAQGQRNLFCV